MAAADGYEHIIMQLSFCRSLEECLLALGWSLGREPTTLHSRLTHCAPPDTHPSAPPPPLPPSSRPQAIRSLDNEHLLFFEPSVAEIWTSGFSTGPGGHDYDDRQVYSCLPATSGCRLFRGPKMRPCVRKTRNFVLPTTIPAAVCGLQSLRIQISSEAVATVHWDVFPPSPYPLLCTCNRQCQRSPMLGWSSNEQSRSLQRRRPSPLECEPCRPADTPVPATFLTTLLGARLHPPPPSAPPRAQTTSIAVSTTTRRPTARRSSAAARTASNGTHVSLTSSASVGPEQDGRAGG